MANTADLNRQRLEQIVGSLQSIRYGHVQITVHDGKIVQVDTTERKRFDLKNDADKTHTSSKSGKNAG